MPKSIHFVSQAAPKADTIVVTGASTRTFNILCELETATGRPIITADTVLYWAIARERGLTLKPIMGSLAKTM